ncbi:MAG: hypothetical protein JO146_00925 [Candidatus Eremiobacteraeota bacterium]|nr:hypothetical protein [Candidatus Eremiobacteraeota bacterium]
MITLPDGTGTPPGQVGFDGKYVTMGSASSANGLIFQFTISGSSATLVNTTMLNGYTRLPAYFIVGANDKKGKQGKAVVATSGGNLGFFKYPAGGNYTFQTTQNWPWSSAVSKGK